jgi:hypothetical protein
MASRARCRGAGLMLALLLAAAYSTCSDPLGGENKPTHVVTLPLPNPLRPGRYMVYWDGKDKNKQTVAAGAYRCVLDGGTYVGEIQMTAMDGTKGKPADSTGTGTGLWFFETPAAAYVLEQNRPEPFYAKDGTNLLFEIPEPSNVVLAIHRKQ